MKNIKTIAFCTFCMCAAIGVQAQIETKKPAGSPVPQVSLPPVQAPEMSNAPKLSTAGVPAAETPSPEARDKNQQPRENEKPALKLVDDKEPATPGGEEGNKIMAGKTTLPAPEINNQSTIDPKQAPQVKTPKPVNGQQQQ